MFTFYFWSAALLCGLAVSEPFGPLKPDKRALKLDKRGYAEYARNLAEGKKTGQISTGWGGVSHRAVDGIWSPQWGKSSCTHTNYAYYPYWWVDLGRRYRIVRVAIQNRADCCAARLSNVKVWVGNDLHNMQVCAIHSAAAGAGEVINLHCRYNVRGRFVKVQLMKKDYLTLCEVAVYGL